MDYLPVVIGFAIGFVLDLMGINIIKNPIKWTFWTFFSIMVIGYFLGWYHINITIK